MVGVATSLLIRTRPAAAAGSPFELSVLAVLHEIRQLLRRDGVLRQALIASIVFWLAAAIVQPTVNALGKRQLEVDDRLTSFLVTVISVGIAGGSLLAGYLSHGRANARIQRIGAWGMFAALALLALRGGPKDHLLGYAGSLLALTVLGVFTGMFAVPLQVFAISSAGSG